MSAHEQFLALAGLSLVVTAPVIAYAATKRLARRWWLMVYYGAGYAIIGAAFVLDAIFAPPLFVHGFVPGMGIALVVEALLLVAVEAFAGQWLIAGLCAGRWKQLRSLSVIVAIALFGVVELQGQPAEPSLRFAQGLAAGLAVGSLFGLLGLGRLANRKQR